MRKVNLCTIEVPGHGYLRDRVKCICQDFDGGCKFFEKSNKRPLGLPREWPACRFMSCGRENGYIACLNMGARDSVLAYAGLAKVNR